MIDDLFGFLMLHKCDYFVSPFIARDQSYSRDHYLWPLAVNLRACHAEEGISSCLGTAQGFARSSSATCKIVCTTTDSSVTRRRPALASGVVLVRAPKDMFIRDIRHDRNE